jgi:transcriptional regulator with XRE-family HTH domain
MGTHADTGGTDLGRRIAEQRRRAGLTRDETANLAGMSPEYLAYLESSETPNPSHGSLTRLAAVLDTDPATLAGAGLSLPPGQRGAAKNAVLEKLTTQESKAHVAPGGVGLFLFDDPSRGPVAFPVNYKMEGDDVVFRTTDGSGGPVAFLRQAPASGRKVAFDVDHLDDALAEGWSVLLSGSARIITDKDELDRAKALGIEPWAGPDLDVYVRLTPDEITGRRIRVTG